MLQNDVVKVDDYRSDYWRTVPVSNDIALKHGWRNTKILKAYSPGLGNLAASVNYLGGADDKKKVISHTLAPYVSLWLFHIYSNINILFLF